MKSPTLHLALFFTSGVSLKTWDETGLFEREVVPYRYLQSIGADITFVTYGDRSDLNYSARLPGIRILCNRWGLPLHVYRRWLPVLHAPSLIRATIIKTQQIRGADRALWTAKLLCKKSVVRCGYLLSENIALDFGADSPETISAKSLEQRVFHSADHIVVTTQKIKRNIIDQYDLADEKISIIPNYIDIDLFEPPVDRVPKPGHLCYIGRLSKEKNLSELLKAIAGLNVQLTLVGEGPLKEELSCQAQELAIKSHFIGKVPNNKIPEYLRNVDLFILPSLIEGHPKALLEAMAYGLPVIASDIPGNRELITHKKTGFLCGTSALEIRKSIIEVLGNRQLMEHMGHRAKEYISSNFSLGDTMEKEIAMLKMVSGNDFYVNKVQTSNINC